MMNNKQTALVLSFSALFLLSACAEQSPNNSPAEPVAPAEKTTATSAPETVATVSEQGEGSKGDGIVAPLAFSLTNLAGETINAVDYRGKWLVINYWATWCAPCRDEMPELVKFQQQNADTVQVVGIAYEDATIDKLKNFARDFNINYPLLTIDVYNPPEFAQEGGLGLPTTIVYNSEGMRHKKHMGPIDAEGLLEMVQ